MLIVQLSPTAMEPVSFQDVQSYLRLSDDENTDLVNALISAARSHIEAVTGVVLVSQSFRQYLDGNTNGPIRLGRFPVQSIDKITGYDQNGEAHIRNDQWQNLRAQARPPSVDLALQGDNSNGIEIEFSAGFGTTSVDLPPQLRQAVLELVAHWYEFRGAIAPHQQAVSLPIGFEKLLEPFKQVRL